ncbi:hypothetical protein AAG747_16085 [Rapidithrix thailandica]|uniref:Lipocalin-like domain-containing protein n=1 Tax=Rapidithrix thailandica TaxID=413964 RepID=A0AAW9S6E9_9BACT
MIRIKYLLSLLLWLAIASLPANKAKAQLQETPNGIWRLAYTQEEGKINIPVKDYTLWDFEGDTLNLVTVGDPDMGTFDSLTIQRFGVRYEHNEMQFDDQVFSVSSTEDSLVLQNQSISFIFKRLDLKASTPSKTASACLKGSYLIRGKNYQDSLEFLNDSLLIHTGEFHSNNPVKKWAVVTYKGIHFLSIQNIFFPLTAITSCSEQQVVLNHLAKNVDWILSPTKSTRQKSELIGSWTATPTYPLPPGTDTAKPFHQIAFEQDSVRIQRFKKVQKLKWNLTEDGKRIYFMDKILKKGGSWKIIECTDQHLTLDLNNSWLFDDNILKFKRN